MVSVCTPQEAKWHAHVLTARAASDDLSKLGQSIFDATVDLNPHQLDAALFAFRSPLSRGAILADEVGLGKTIEAALIISQLWAEHRRRVLVIAPTILRKQWASELSEKFFLPCRVLDSKDYNLAIKQGHDPLASVGQVIICSYNFAAARTAAFAAVPWDLVVIDEAHRLRNVWKPSSKIANALHDSVASKPLVLLTATPLQNTLLELYGLVSFIDPHLFGSLDAFRMRYMRGTVEERQLGELKQRLKPICQRTLRRQVTEYVRFTNRVPITQDFTPTTSEQQLYDMVSEYLQRPSLHALPTSQRALMTLILRKLLASSSFAISKTLKTLADRLETRNRQVLEALGEDFEALEETADEWSEDNGAVAEGEVNPAEIRAEIEELRRFGTLADSILVNAKGEALLVALQHGFTKLRELGANQKAVIFTESRRTQDYLVELLNNNGFSDRTLTINGTNSDDRSGAMYKRWLERHKGEAVVTGNKAVDLRAALVEHFRDHADILIATEAASEGVNLQFCSLVVNFDLPWNPQRIEQRIGRCHRYGQQHDVVVVNFLNRSNEADRRVFELLDEKFKLFDGVFGSSAEILGALESGVDFERRIAEIYQSCRTREEIDAAFDALRTELDTEIQVRMSDTRAKLLENFDDEVHQKLRLNLDASERQLDRLERALWSVTKWGLDGHATFDDDTYCFTLHSVPSGLPTVEIGRYRYVRQASQEQGTHPYRLGHPLAQAILEQALGAEHGVDSLRFSYSSLGRKIGLLDPLRGRSGWVRIEKLTIESFENEDVLISAVVLDDGTEEKPEIAEALFQAECELIGQASPDSERRDRLDERAAFLVEQAVTRSNERNNRYFAEELEKLDRWADDLKHGLEAELKELDQQIRQAGRESKLAPTLDAKLEIVKRQKELEQTRNRKRRELFDAQDRIDVEKGQLIDQVEARMQQSVRTELLMVFRFQVV